MNYFDGVDIFASLSYEDKEKLSTFCQLRELNSGDILFKQGDEAMAMYLIMEGKFSVIKNESEVNVLETGDIVGEIAFLQEKGVRNATIKCIQAGVVTTMIKFSMGEMLNKYPDLHAKIQEIIKERNI